MHIYITNAILIIKTTRFWDFVLQTLLPDPTGDHRPPTSFAPDPLSVESKKFLKLNYGLNRLVIRAF